MAIIDIKVPDIGDFKDIPVIELLVKPGDVIRKEAGLVTLESDKATMEVPSTARRHSHGTAREARRHGLDGQRAAHPRYCGSSRCSAIGGAACCHARGGSR